MRADWRMFVVPALALAAACTDPARNLAQQSGPPKVSKPGAYSGYGEAQYDGYELSSFYVPVRDGTKLAVDLLRPTRAGVVASGRFPVLWMHTPYNRRSRDNTTVAETYAGYAAQLVKYGYNVAVVDFRGLYASYGQNRAFNAGEFYGPAFTDAYDITEWLAAQPWSTGKVGMWGCSATGGSQLQAALTRPPSLKAIMPMSPAFDTYTFGVFGGVSPPGAVDGTGHPAVAVNPNAARDAAAQPVDGPDAQAELAAALAQHIDNADAIGVVPYRDSVSAPLGGLKWWEVSSPSHYLKELQASGIGVYTTATWDEFTTKPAAFWVFGNLPADHTKFTVGPGTHCAWNKVEEETGFSIVTEERRFFDYWLKGIDNGVMSEPAVTYYTYNAPQGQNWRTSKTWPLADEKRTPFHLSANTLSPGVPDKATTQVVEQSPPLPDRVTNATPFEGGVTYETAPLEKDTEVTGHPDVQLWISTRAPDVDVVARLEDVAPDGTAKTYQMIGRLRASGRELAPAPYNNFGLPWHAFRAADFKPLESGKPASLQFDMLPMSYIFPAGHRIRLHVIFTDPKQRAGQPAVSILQGATTRSVLTLPVIPDQPVQPKATP